jgi:hypothetical protein
MPEGMPQILWHIIAALVFESFARFRTAGPLKVLLSEGLAHGQNSYSDPLLPVRPPFIWRLRPLWHLPNPAQRPRSILNPPFLPGRGQTMDMLWKAACGTSMDGMDGRKLDGEAGDPDQTSAAIPDESSTEMDDQVRPQPG